MASDWKKERGEDDYKPQLIQPQPVKISYKELIPQINTNSFNSSMQAPSPGLQQAMAAMDISTTSASSIGSGLTAPMGTMMAAKSPPGSPRLSPNTAQGPFLYPSISPPGSPRRALEAFESGSDTESRTRSRSASVTSVDSFLGTTVFFFEQENGRKSRVIRLSVCLAEHIDDQSVVSRLSRAQSSESIASTCSAFELSSSDQELGQLEVRLYYDR